MHRHSRRRVRAAISLPLSPVLQQMEWKFVVVGFVVARGDGESRLSAVRSFVRTQGRSERVELNSIPSSVSQPLLQMGDAPCNSAAACGGPSPPSTLERFGLLSPPQPCLLRRTSSQAVVTSLRPPLLPPPPSLPFLSLPPSLSSSSSSLSLQRTDFVWLRQCVYYLRSQREERRGREGQSRADSDVGDGDGGGVGSSCEGSDL